jgi:hypothetical protein
MLTDVITEKKILDFQHFQPILVAEVLLVLLIFTKYVDNSGIDHTTRTASERVNSYFKNILQTNNNITTIL